MNFAADGGSGFSDFNVFSAKRLLLSVGRRLILVGHIYYIREWRITPNNRGGIPSIYIPAKTEAPTSVNHFLMLSIPKSRPSSNSSSGYDHFSTGVNPNRPLVNILFSNKSGNKTGTCYTHKMDKHERGMSKIKFYDFRERPVSLLTLLCSSFI